METEEVRVRDCLCPDKPHDGDVVYLNAKLSAPGGIRAEQEIAKGFADPADLTNRLLISFVRSEATGWNVTDEAGKPVPFDVEALLADWSLARPVVTRAGELYTAAAIAPFQSKPAERSPTGRTPASTSRTRKPTPSPSVSQ